MKPIKSSKPEKIYSFEINVVCIDIKVKEEYFKQLIKSAWSTHFENENVQVSTIIGNQEYMK